MLMQFISNRRALFQLLNLSNKLLETKSCCKINRTSAEPTGLGSKLLPFSCFHHRNRHLVIFKQPFQIYYPNLDYFSLLYSLSAYSQLYYSSDERGDSSE